MEAKEVKTGEKPAKLKGTYTLRVPKSKDELDKFIEVDLKEIDEPTYIAAQKMIRQGQDIAATKFLIQNLCITGNANEILDSFQRVLACRDAVADLIAPMDAELKKN